MIKPINIGFKIGDSVVLWDEQYCFIAPPGSVEDEIISLNLVESEIVVVDSESICPRVSKRVCFSSGSRIKEGCDINVDTNNKRVVKDSGSVDYIDPLLFSAVLSDPEVYECQIERIGSRAEGLASIYRSKSLSIASQSNGCSSAIGNSLVAYESIASDLSSETLSNLDGIGEDIKRANGRTICPLWEED